MSWKLWLDDERPAPEGYVCCKSTEAAQAVCRIYGPPERMDLDHDLGGCDTAMRFISWLFSEFGGLPPTYAVHSANPVGAENIHAYMRTWKKILTLE